MVFKITHILKDLLSTVSNRADKLLVLDNGKSSTTAIDSIQHCEVECIKTEDINNLSCSLVLYNGVIDAEFASVCLSCLLPDGYVMLVTKCAQIDESLENQPEPTTYSVDKVLKSTPSVKSFGFVFVASRTIEKYEDNHMLYSSVFKKVLLDPKLDRRLDSLQDVLNDRTYTTKILRIFDKVFSREGDPGFISTGGADVTEECLKKLNLQPGQRVLDVGCGAGGPLIQTAKKYKTHMIGVDISSNMINAAAEATEKLQDLNIELEVCDIERREFPEGYFDAIYSKDVILHIVRKKDLFKKFLKWLKPGGKLLITDYCKTENEQFSDLMQAYMEKRANVWFLITPPTYGQLIKDAGFVNNDVQVKHDIFRECAVKENISFVNKKESLLKEFDQAFVDDWLDVWKKKVQIIDNGDLTWGVFYSEKAL
ncbi:phosphoethanolamine N-methyltransferase-like [Antedon mediterranea]|uniref:phosphoethanolamine N-methyltransferase-like n=1 Tax=Antedon mediterranea TaxID=105859 RepID=UPI003AF65281